MGFQCKNVKLRNILYNKMGGDRNWCQFFWKIKNLDSAQKIKPDFVVTLIYVVCDSYLKIPSHFG